MSEFTDHCVRCGNDDVDLERCADCGRHLCDECVRWCGSQNDYYNGDYFCWDCEPEGNDE